MENIKNFWTKLFTSSETPNKIPYHYMKESYNARINDGWIWPRKWKRVLINSIIWTTNQWGFVLNGDLYQITNSKIYKIKTDKTQEEKADIWYDKPTDVQVYNFGLNSKVLIVAKWEKLKVFDGSSISEPSTQPNKNNGIIEFIRWYSFLWVDNILYVSKYIEPDKIENAYDFTWSGSQQLTLSTEIVGLKGTMDWLFIFTKDKVNFLWANSLQNVSWAATFIMSPLWDGWEPISNRLIAASGNQIFYLTKNHQLKTINYIRWTDKTQIWELDNIELINVKEFLQSVEPEQISWFSFYNHNEENIHFFLRQHNHKYNNVCLIYDLLNKTYNIDTERNYNFIVRNGALYYGFSDINSSIYEDWVGNNDNAIFKVKTQVMNYQTISQKLFKWFNVCWGIKWLTELKVKIFIDWVTIFSDKISRKWQPTGIWEIWWIPIWHGAIGWNLNKSINMEIFNRGLDQGDLYYHWTDIQIEFSCDTTYKDFVIDLLWIDYVITTNIDINNKF